MDPNAAELVFDSSLELIQLIERDVVRIGIQLCQHALNRGFHQLAAADLQPHSFALSNSR